MKLYIKTTEYGDGRKKYELYRKKVVKILGFTIVDKLVPFEEDVLNYLDGSLYLARTHFVYTDKESLKCAKDAYELDGFDYKGYKISPCHGNDPEFFGLGEYKLHQKYYCIPLGKTNVSNVCHRDTLEACEYWVDEMLEEQDKRKKRETIVDEKFE